MKKNDFLIIIIFTAIITTITIQNNIARIAQFLLLLLSTYIMIKESIKNKHARIPEYAQYIETKKGSIIGVLLIIAFYTGAILNGKYRFIAQDPTAPALFHIMINAMLISLGTMLVILTLPKISKKIRTFAIKQQIILTNIFYYLQLLVFALGISLIVGAILSFYL